MGVGCTAVGMGGCASVGVIIIPARIPNVPTNVSQFDKLAPHIWRVFSVGSLSAITKLPVIWDIAQRPKPHTDGTQ